MPGFPLPFLVLFVNGLASGVVVAAQRVTSVLDQIHIPNIREGKLVDTNVLTSHKILCDGANTG